MHQKHAVGYFKMGWSRHALHPRGTSDIVTMEWGVTLAYAGIIRKMKHLITDSVMGENPIKYSSSESLLNTKLNLVLFIRMVAD